jgi:hypothetical protein
MKNLIVALLVMISLTGANVVGQVNVINVNKPASRPTGNGVYYALPRTVLRIDVVLKVEERAKGPLSEYAEKYLGIKDAVRFDNTYHEISKTTITPIAEPDPDEVYYVEMGQRDSRDPRMLLLDVNEKGFLVSANTIDAHTLKAPTISRQTVFDGIEYTSGNKAGFTLTGLVNIFSDTVIRRVAVDTTMVEQLHFRTRALDKPAQDLANEIMDKIEDVREARFRLLTGFQETPYELGTIRYMDEQLKKTEEEYIAMFRGKTFIYFETYTYYYMPTKKQENSSTPVFMFSSSSGISPLRSGVGENVELMLETTGLGQLIDGFSGGKGAVASQNGIAYRVPAYVVASLKIGKEEIHSEPVIINQFGATLRLPAQKFKAEFSPETGGIKMLVLE